MCRCRDCGLMTDNADIDVELDCGDRIVFEWCDTDDSHMWNLPPCHGSHKLQTDLTAYELLLQLGVIDDPYKKEEYITETHDDNRRMDRRVNEYLAWLDKQFRQALDAADSDAPSEYQEGLTDGFDRAEAAFRRIFDVKEK